MTGSTKNEIPDLPWELPDLVRQSRPLIHCITNYVTAADVANIILAAGGSPIMADHPEETAETAALCGGLLLNLGTLKESSVPAMLRAGCEAGRLGLPIILDPVGTGSSRHRTEAALRVLQDVACTIIRGNASELKALSQALDNQESDAESRGVDASFADRMTEDSLAPLIQVSRSLSARTGAVIVMTGENDIVTDGQEVFVNHSGSPMMARITGSGCMLDGILAAFAAAADSVACAANHGVACAAHHGVTRTADHSIGCGASFPALPQPDKKAMLGAAVMAVSAAGLCGEQAFYKTEEARGGTGSFRMFFIDCISLLDAGTLKGGARIEVR